MHLKMSQKWTIFREGIEFQQHLCIIYSTMSFKPWPLAKIWKTQGTQSFPSFHRSLVCLLPWFPRPCFHGSRDQLKWGWNSSYGYYAEVVVDIFSGNFTWLLRLLSKSKARRISNENSTLNCSWSLIPADNPRFFQNNLINSETNSD